MTIVTHFLIIAVERYNSREISQVAYAQADAEELAKAWQGLGYDKDDFVVLLNSAATKTTIEAHLKKISTKASKDERIVIFFAGHGCAVHGDNMIVPVDADISMLKDTCVSINTILGYLKKAESERNILFLDCCHSGFEPGEHIRRMATDFRIDDLVVELKDEIYCVGFASCKSNQESMGHPKVKHGIWSHFLIQALSGNAEEETYDGNTLVSDKLQSYLRKETAGFVKANTVTGHAQTPMAFGSYSDRFVIEDLTMLFEAREAAMRAAAFNMTSIEILDIEEGDIKDLPDFVKGRHHVPDKVGRAQRDFVKSKVGNLVKDEIDEMCEKIKDTLGYTRKQIQVSCDEGDSEGSITTPDFSYAVEIYQSDENPKEYIIKRSLIDIRSPTIINDDNFNRIFDGQFRRLSFTFDRRINTNELIDRIESGGKAKEVKLEYNPNDTSRVRIIFSNSINEIVIEPYSINITTPKALSPAQLVEAYKETNRLLDSKKIKLVGESK
ncbi:Caspase domain-containing protein [Hydrobacter penzbergensis]|uniref:Caspase domain-containing protein n=1 Tax=Hydrobacter penzbergensis TaxID=1235997 RepID=A0A8X8IHJ1_9BACT|nr:caspase family protein [Hydrobacter penzbergensis]SDX01809.1 Caspase domain-containing protein [Hydrobacter penzbergensis]